MQFSGPDLFVKKAPFDAAAISDSAIVTYFVVIENMQMKIDAENPRMEEFALLLDPKVINASPFRCTYKSKRE